MIALRTSCLLALLGVASCRAPEVGHGALAERDAAPSSSMPSQETAEIELVESAPVETTLDHADLRDASDVWPEMLGRAQRTIDVAELYASEAEGAALATSRLTASVVALERAAARGVRVRVLADASFALKYPATLERLRGAGVLVRTFDVGARAGGVLHAKYFVVDGVESFVGSQNFDWRALAHIQELGVRVRSGAIAGALLDVFETDWALADGAPGDARVRAHAVTRVSTPSGETLAFVASPKGWLPDESTWDLPRILAMLAGARRSAIVQLLTYSTKNRDKSDFPDLDEALRAAAARGVRVRLLVSHWADKPDSASRRSLAALADVPNVEVRVMTIPAWSGGEIPFARVAHAKYLVVDGARAWVGTSNWEGDYFLRSRNVGVVAEGGRLPDRLARFFEDGWSSDYARPLRAISSTPPDAGPRAGAAPP